MADPDFIYYDELADVDPEVMDKITARVISSKGFKVHQDGSVEVYSNLMDKIQAEVTEAMRADLRDKMGLPEGWPI